MEAQPNVKPFWLIFSVFLCQSFKTITRSTATFSRMLDQLPGIVTKATSNFKIYATQFLLAFSV